MKKQLLTLGCLLAATAAMPLSARTFGFGVTGGLNVSKLDVDHAKNNSGWYAGLTGKVSIPILNFGVDGSILYSSEKAGIMGNDEDAQFVSIPVNLRYDFSLPILSELVTPYVFIGPQYDWNVNNAKVEGKDEDGNVVSSYKLKEGVWKGNVGVGVIVCSHWQVSYAYSLPLSDSWYSNISSLSDNTKMSTHKIGVAYYF
jgi:hypothetical protein